MSKSGATPQHIIKRIRQRLGFDENDASKDADVESMSPHQKLRHVVAWELGDPAWADTIIQWARDCGMRIEDE